MADFLSFMANHHHRGLRPNFLAVWFAGWFGILRKNKAHYGVCLWCGGFVSFGSAIMVFYEFNHLCTFRNVQNMDVINK